MPFKFVTGFLLLATIGYGSAAQQWTGVGPEGGMVVSLGVAPNDRVYLGTADGHVFVSEDNATSWELRGRVGNRLDTVVTRLVVDPQDRNHVFASVWYRETAEDGGVFRSDNGARSWRASGLEGEAVRALEAVPSNRGHLIAGTRTGVFRSRDDGASWQRISPEGDPELRNVDSIAIDPRDPDVIYAGTYHLPWRTTDGGKSWVPVVAGIIDDSDVMSLRVDRTNPDRLYMSACSGIYRSENQGAEWTKLQGIPYAARRTHSIVQDPDHPKIWYAGTTEGAWLTGDGGETWTRITPKDWVVNSIALLPGKSAGSGRAVLGTETGIQISDDGGKSFIASDHGFLHIVVKQLVAGFAGSEQLLSIIQRNGWELLESLDKGKTWGAVLPRTTESPRSVALNPGQIQSVFASPWGWIVRGADGQFWLQNQETKTWRPWKLRIAIETVQPKSAGGGRRSTTRPVALSSTADPIEFAQNAAVVASRQGVLRCPESGLCARLKSFGHTGAVAGVWTSPDAKQIAILQDGKVGISSDGGETASWRDLPVAASQALWVDIPGSVNHPTMALGTSVGLYLSLDQGAHWERASGGLPAGSIESWLPEPGFWLADERSGGMYLSWDEGRTWTRVDEDAERGRFAGLISMGSGRVLAGSQSEGMLELTLPSKH